MTHSIQQTQITAAEVLACLLANMPGHLYWKDRQGVYLACNNYHGQRLGLRLGKHAVGKTDAQLLDKKSKQRFPYEDEQVILQGETRIVEEEATLKSGLSLVLLSLKTPIRTKKKQVLGMLNISIDISSERQMEKRIRLLKEAVFIL